MQVARAEASHCWANAITWVISANTAHTAAIVGDAEARMSAPRYRFVIVEEPRPRRTSPFHGMALRAYDGGTDITGPLSDQSRLRGLIERIAGPGTPAAQQHPFETDDAEADVQPHTQPAGGHKPRHSFEGTVNP
jgi:hypothetical protein